MRTDSSQTRSIPGALGEAAVVRELLSGKIRCGACGADMFVEMIGGVRRYICRCARAVPADELDVIVLGKVYDRRRSSGITTPVRLCDESRLVDEYVAGVTIANDWTRLTLRWA